VPQVSPGQVQIKTSTTVIHITHHHNNQSSQPNLTSVSQAQNSQPDSMQIATFHITCKMDHAQPRLGLNQPARFNSSNISMCVIMLTTPCTGHRTMTEQRETRVDHSELIIIPSPDWHNGFLLQFGQINRGS
jgi:hypothetical protein